MQTVSLTSNRKNVRALDSNTSVPLHLRALRLVTEKYSQRERPSVAAEFTLIIVIALTAAWPILTLVHSLSLVK